MPSPESGGPSPHTESCTVCGAGLEYLEQSTEVVCTVCGCSERGHVRCPEGHYVCETCHGAGFMAILRPLLDAAESTDPLAIAEALMAREELPMLGCEHAHIAAGSLMTALRNRGDLGVSQRHVDESLERTARQAVSAYCGLSGVCGVVPALGSCYSVLVGAQCGKGPETQATMTLVSRLAAVTADEAEPGCCKAYVRRTLRETEAFITERLGIAFPAATPLVCTDGDRHPHGCRGPRCEWHPDHAGAAPGHVTDPAAATTPGHPNEECPMSTTGPGAQEHYDQFFGLAYADGALDAKTKILVSLGASLAAGCAP